MIVERGETMTPRVRTFLLDHKIHEERRSRVALLLACTVCIRSSRAFNVYRDIVIAPFV